jgi:hypothetical protein
VDAIRSGVLGEAKDVPAVGEERAVSLRGVQRRPQPKRGQVRNELGCRRALVAGKDRYARKENLIG